MVLRHLFSRDDADQMPQSTSKACSVLEEETSLFSTHAFQETKHLMSVAIPIVFYNILSTLVMMTGQVMIGHIGANELAAVAIGMTYYNVPRAMIAGFTTALDTLAAQTYATAGQEGVLLWTKRAIVLQILACIPASIVLYRVDLFTSLVIGEGDIISELANKYCRLLIPALCVNALSLIFEKYLMCQNIVKPAAYVAAISAIINLVLCQLLVFKAGMGMAGAPIAHCICFSVQMLLLFAIAWIVTPKDEKKSGLNNRLEKTKSNRKSSKQQSRPQCTPINVLLYATPMSPSVRARPEILELLQKNAFKPEIKSQFSPFTESLSPSQHRLLSTLMLSPPRKYGSFRFTHVQEKSINTNKSPATRSLPDLETGYWDSDGSETDASNSPILHVYKRSAKVFVMGAFLEYISLGLPGALMTGFEYLSYEIMTSLAAQFGAINVGAHTILLTVWNFFYIGLPFAITIASTIRIAYLLGQGQASRARMAGIVSRFIGTGFMFIYAVLLVLFRHKVGKLFSSDDRVIMMVSKLAPTAAVFLVVDAYQVCSSGICRAMGRQSVVAVVNAIGFWCIGLTSAIALGFYANFGIFGVWWGMLLGLFAVAFIFHMIIRSTNWQNETELVQLRIQKFGSVAIGH